MTGIPTLEELWNVFWKHEENSRYGTDEAKLASATMAQAISEIIACREFRTYRRPA